ncbi:MAG: glycerol dehydrogenase [Planctomycetota bacterium]
MYHVFASPLRYTQGPGATHDLGKEITGLGICGPACIIAGRSAREQLAEIWQASFASEGLTYHVHNFGGECSRTEIALGRAAAELSSAKVIVAAGGGKAIDTARAIAAELDLPCVVCPTIASTDSPCSALSVIYTDAGVMDSMRLFAHNPALVLVDSLIIAKAPLRLLVAGMGDALSTWFEARACMRSGAQNLRGGVATRASLAIAELCWKILVDDGTAAVDAMKSATIPPALERIIETNTLLSGLGFESAGLAAAHAIHNGLTIAPEVKSFYHGEKVAFGTLAQLVLEQAPTDEIQQVLEFCSSVGLPVSLNEIGLGSASPDRILQIAERSVIASESIHNMPFPVTAKMVAQAIHDASGIGSEWRQKLGQISTG